MFVLGATEQEIHATIKLFLGDFNEILCENDKLGGRQMNLNRALDFKSCLDDCNFLDLGFSGPKFTWLNRRQISDLILERIDRCFANPAWRTLYLEASVTYLPRDFPDHCLVLLELTRPPPTATEKPFRFHTMWMHHPDFPNVVRKTWEPNPNLQTAVKSFVDNAKQWNKSVFGNIFARKKRVLARLNEAQKALSNGPNCFLIHLERSLIEEYNLIMQQEEEYWALKYRLNWATYDDSNTSFFHVSTLVKRHRNKIRMLKNFVGSGLPMKRGSKTTYSRALKRFSKRSFKLPPLIQGSTILVAAPLLRKRGPFWMPLSWKKKLGKAFGL
ncbi:uncharacterized protein LOC142638831 [Castanea sativa]|uniref:uncharacterized protein LOC142638831 n=1 Tax=Castanea sativa TaxID=21020 RepID=UPI003F653C47